MIKTCLLPWSGEFGWYIMIHIRRFHLINSDYKIAICEKGEDCLYPSADEIHHFHDPTPDACKRFGRPVPHILLRKIIRQLRDKHPGLKFLNATFDRQMSTYRDVYLDIRPSKQRQVQTDLLLAPRWRGGTFTGSNFRWWPSIIGELAPNYNIGIIGKRELSYPTQYPVIKSWEIEDSVDCIVDMMRNTKAVICCNSGMAHLAIVVQVPLIVMGHAGGSTSMWMRRQRNHSVPFIAKFGSRRLSSWDKTRDFLLNSIDIIEHRRKE